MDGVKLKWDNKMEYWYKIALEEIEYICDYIIDTVRDCNDCERVRVKAYAILSQRENYTGAAKIKLAYNKIKTFWEKGEFCIHHSADVSWLMSSVNSWLSDMKYLIQRIKDLNDLVDVVSNSNDIFGKQQDSLKNLIRDAQHYFESGKISEATGQIQDIHKEVVAITNAHHSIANQIREIAIKIRPQDSLRTLKISVDEIVQTREETFRQEIEKLRWECDELANENNYLRGELESLERDNNSLRCTLDDQENELNSVIKENKRLKNYLIRLGISIIVILPSWYLLKFVINLVWKHFNLTPGDIIESIIGGVILILIMYVINLPKFKKILSILRARDF